MGIDQVRLAAWEASITDSDGWFHDLRAEAHARLATRAQALLAQGVTVGDVAKKLGVTSEQLATVLPPPPPKPELPKLVITDEDRAANRQLKADIQAVHALLQGL